MSDQRPSNPMNCPCCGGHAECEENVGATDQYRFSVECQVCWLETDEFSTAQEAIASWNKRAAVEPKTDEVPRLKDQIQSLQAQVDQLMFEYCPQEMSAEQIAEYEASQRATIPPCASCESVSQIAGDTGIENLRVMDERDRYKQALYQANGRLMQLGLDPVKLEYSGSTKSEGRT